MTELAKLDYRLTVNGLRAIAVLAVLIFHGCKEFLPGGFVGVDIFFVISGYLITRIIHKDLQNDKFTFVNFYQRRISRIFPLFAAVIATTMFASWFLYQPQDFASVGALAMASIIGFTNIKLVFQGNYFESSVDSQPFLHYWSLAVEEQYYVCFPIMLVMLRRLRSFWYWRGRIVLSLCVFSFLLCVWATFEYPVYSFYLLPFRGWELLAGSLLAIYQVQFPKKYSALVGWTGVCLLIASIAFLNEGTSFPGYWAVLPVIGTMLCIGCPENSIPIWSRVLSLRFFQYVGDLSYALYLWHWPIYSLVDYSMYLDSFSVRLATKVVLIIGFSVASHHVFEKPIRGYLNMPTSRRVCFLSFFLTSFTLFLLGFYIRSTNYLDADERTLATGGIQIQQRKIAKKVVLLGDSHGSMYGCAIRDTCKSLGLDCHIMSVAAADPIPPSSLYDQSMIFLRKEKPDIIIVACAWANKIGTDERKLQNYLNGLLENCKCVILLTQPPQLPKHAGRAFIRANGDITFEEDSDVRLRRESSNALVLSMRSHVSGHIIVIDTAMEFISESGEIRYHDNSGKPYFHDRNHLNGTGANLLRPKIETAIKDFLAAESEQRNH